MYHRDTHEDEKSQILSSLGGEGNCRVVIATTALGLGLNFRTVSHVLMFAVPEDVETIVQQAGRAGRDGSQAHAVVYKLKRQRHADNGIKELLKNKKTMCFREALYKTFEQNTTCVEPKHLCCTHCHSKCACTPEGCREPKPVYELFQCVPTVPTRTRQVLPEHKVLIREKLESYRDSLVPENAHLFTSKKGCTGFGTEVIDAVIEHSPEIFDMSYIKRTIPVFFQHHANEILKTIGEVFQDLDGLDTSHLETSDSSRFDLPDMYYSGYFDEDEKRLSLGSSVSVTSVASAMSGLSLMPNSD